MSQNAQNSHMALIGDIPLIIFPIQMYGIQPVFDQRFDIFLTLVDIHSVVPKVSLDHEL